ncbi:MAG: ribosome maturation factor RimM [Polyangiaceae bacterium]
MPIAADSWVPLAEVARPHGVRGEVRLKLYNADSDVLLDRDEILLRMPKGEEHEVSIDGARRADTTILLKLHSIDDRDRADEIRSAVICVRRKDFPPLEDGEFYVCDIEGARVLVAEGDGEPRPIGVVAEYLSYPSVDTIRVRADDGGKPWEVPLVEAFVRSIDVATGVVVLHTLAGIERG